MNDNQTGSQKGYQPGSDQTTPGLLSALEWLHPDGFVNQAVVVGNACPNTLIPVSRIKDKKEADLILFAPSPDECQTPGWIEHNIASLNDRLAPDGFIYALVPRQWRWQVRRLFKRHGLCFEVAIAHLPDWNANRYLIPLKIIPSDYAFSNLFPTHTVKRYLALTTLRMPGGDRLLSLFFPFVGLVAQRPGSKALSDWLFRLTGITGAVRSAAIIASWRNQYPSIVVPCFSKNAYPVAIAKTAFPRAGAREQPDEASLLERLGESARQAGADIPKSILATQVGGYSLFLQTAIEGRCLAAELAGHPSRMPEAMELIAAWLERWNTATKCFRRLNDDLLERVVLGPIRHISPQIPDGQAYRSWLSMHYLKLDQPVPLVAAHNDLTTWNILLGRGNRLGIVDWKEASSEALPMVDFFYAMVDAVSVAGGYDHENAFLACFAPAGSYSDLARRLSTRLQNALQIPPPMMSICLHACFLHHAANEQTTARSGDKRPFLQILRRLAQDRMTLE